MCGRFVSREQAAIEREFHIKVLNPFERVYNAAPTMQLPVVRASHAAPDVPNERDALPMRWGLIPSWWSQPTHPTATINARSEEAATKPMWRGPVRQSRCLIPAMGWYEWKTERAGEPAAAGKTPGAGKTPYYIYAASDVGFCFAGLWSEWRSPAGDAQLSFAILTRAASEALQPVHHRMPVVLPPTAYDDWLAVWPKDPSSRLADFVAAALNDFAFHPVSRYVNTPRNQGKKCLERAESS